MDPIALLTDEHHLIRDLIHEILDIGEDRPRERAARLEELAQILAVHSAGEEEVVYPRLNPVADADELQRAYHEHHELDLLLDELSSLPPDEREWTAKLEELASLVERHVEDEEQQLLLAMREAFHDEELQEVARELMRVRAAAAEDLPRRAAAVSGRAPRSR